MSGVVNMEVPEDIFSQMQAYMERLKLTSASKNEVSSNEEEEEHKKNGISRVFIFKNKEELYKRE